ncbi:MAG: MurR/RpiR family transcriptional regulator [Coprobacillaceae bacterium]
MSCLLKIQGMRNSLTETEKILADYVEKNKHNVITYSVHKLAEETKTSTAAVVRFSQKLGYVGFTELKLDLVVDLKKEPKKLDTLLDINDDIPTLLEKVKQSNLQTIMSTYTLLDAKEIEAVLTKLESCKTLYLLGLGGSGIICQEFQHKLLRIGKHTEFLEDTLLQLAVIPNITKDDLVIIISSSGKPNKLKKMAKWLQQKEIETAVITSSKYNDLAKLCTHVLTIPLEEEEVRIGAMSSQLSCLLVVDVLYYGLVRNNKEDISDKLLETRRMIDEIEM